MTSLRGVFSKGLRAMAPSWAGQIRPVRLLQGRESTMSSRILRGTTSRFSAVLFCFVPFLPAEAQDIDVPGNLTMRNSSQTAGNVLKNGVPFIHNFGSDDNVFLGIYAGNLSMSGGSNTACGAYALQWNTDGENNTAIGTSALQLNTGLNNTASGVNALGYNTTGNENTASGVRALFRNTTGDGNTAIGFQALLLNTTGHANTASGAYALQYNATGNNNTASGWGALYLNTA